MSDPKAPEPLEYIELECSHCATDQCVELDELREALYAHGLHIVSEADRKVLEAMGNAHPRALKNPRTYGEDLIESCDAELARRSGT